jgi:hypothetical protein
VLATLEAIVADPAEFSKCADPRTALYRLFLKVWGTVPVNDHVDQASFTGDEAGAHRNLEAMTLRPRIAFLLSSPEVLRSGRSVASSPLFAPGRPCIRSRPHSVIARGQDRSRFGNPPTITPSGTWYECRETATSAIWKAP